MQTAIYVRLSDEDRNKRFAEDESESIQNQKSLLAEYCRERNWDIYDIYCDEDYSGTDSSRPDFNRMLADCEKGKIDIVLCKSQSRFSRDMEIVEKYLSNKFLEWGVRFVSIIDHVDTCDSSTKKSRQITGLTNEWYCEEVSENVRKVLQHKREAGQFTGSFAPYGYAVDPDNKNHLVIDENAAAVVREIFRMYNQGYGYRKICIVLNEQNIPSPSAYKKERNSNYRNINAENRNAEGLWTHTTIYRIVRDQTYIGSLVQGRSHNVSYKNKKRIRVPEKDRIVVKNTHEAIIDNDTWAKAQARLASRTRASCVTQELTLLGGKVKCAVCGAAMKRNVYPNKQKTKMYYNLTCGTYKVGAMNCPNKSAISGLQLEKIILDEINNLLADYYDTNMIEEEKRKNNSLNLLEKNFGEITDKIRQIENKLAKTYDNFLDEIISEEQYKLFSDRYTAEKNELRRKLSDVEQKLTKVRERQKNAEDKRLILDKYKHIDKLSRDIIDEFIDTILIGEKKGNEKREVTIIWNF